jgi:hypothetical protein
VLARELLERELYAMPLETSGPRARFFVFYNPILIAAAE